MKNRTRSTTVLLVAGGLFFGLVLAEGVLQAAGLLYRMQPGHRAQSPVRPDDERRIRVICVGDSNTFGIGAPPGSSYPDQLQRMLDDRAPGVFRVYNLGMPGSNSSMLVHRLPEWLRQYRPRAVLVLTGINDCWNMQESDHWMLLTGWKRARANLEMSLSRLRAYKLLRIALHRARLPARREVPPASRDEACEREIDRAERMFHQLQDAERAREIIADLLRKGYRNDRAYCLLGKTYHVLWKVAPAEENYLKAIRLNPYSREAHRELLRLYIDAQRRNEAVRHAERMLEFFPEDSAARQIARFGLPVGEAFFQRLLERNLERMARTARDRGAVLVVQNYPFCDKTYIRNAISPVEATSGVPFVDHRAAFLKVDLSQYLNPDTHPNEKGYHVMAANLLPEVLKLQ